MNDRDHSGDAGWEEMFGSLNQVPEAAWNDDDAGRAEAILRATLAVQRRRRVWRRAVAAFGLAVVFSAGLAVGRISAPGSTPEPVQIEPNDSNPPNSGPSPREVRPDPNPEPAVLAALDPADLEREAERADGVRRSQLMRQAGDAFLQQDYDIASAVRCYREVVAKSEATSPPNSTWLLRALIDAR